MTCDIYVKLSETGGNKKNYVDAAHIGQRTCECCSRFMLEKARSASQKICGDSGVELIAVLVKSCEYADV